MQGQDYQQDHGQVHHQVAPHNLRRDQKRNHQLKFSTPIQQRGNPFNTTRRRTPWAHWHHYSVDALHYPLDYSMG